MQVLWTPWVDVQLVVQLSVPPQPSGRAGWHWNWVMARAAVQSRATQVGTHALSVHTVPSAHAVLHSVLTSWDTPQASTTVPQLAEVVAQLKSDAQLGPL